MARNVFFSFHFERDAWRAGQVRNSGITKMGIKSAGFMDKAKWERVRLGGDRAIKRWIDNQIKGTTVTVVLIGSETYRRKYVKYEIEKSLERGNGLLGIYIHRLRNFQGLRSSKGRNPLDNYEVENETGRFVKLSNLVYTYDWVLHDGYTNFGKWVEKAARQARL